MNLVSFSKASRSPRFADTVIQFSSIKETNEKFLPIQAGEDCLVFKDLSYTGKQTFCHSNVLPARDGAKILHNMSGAVRGGKLTALMGASGLKNMSLS